MSIKSLNVNPDRGVKEAHTGEATAGGSQNAPNTNKIARNTADAARNEAEYHDTGFNDTWYATEYTLVREKRQCVRCGFIEYVSSNPLIRMDCVMNPHRHRLVIPENAPPMVDKTLLPRTITVVETELKRCVNCFKPSHNIERPPAPTWASILQKRRERGSGNDFIEAMKPKAKKPAKEEVKPTSLEDFL